LLTTIPVGEWVHEQQVMRQACNRHEHTLRLGSIVIFSPRPCQQRVVVDQKITKGGFNLPRSVQPFSKVAPRMP